MRWRCFREHHPWQVGILVGVSATTQVWTVGAAIAGGVAALVGYLGLIATVSGTDAAVGGAAGEPVLNVAYLALGSWLLHQFVRVRSQRTWVTALRVMAVVLTIVTGTVSYGNVTGDLDDSNWPLLVLLALAGAVGLMFMARRAVQRPQR